MWLGRVRCALALSWIAACSFPDYQRTAAPGGTAGSGGTTPTAYCDNHIRDGFETAVDCGGPDCNACPQCSDSMRNGDETGVDCGGSCNPCPRCDDAQQNGSETDVDCGGICSARCNTNQRCQNGTDCASLVCASVCQPGDCKDGVRNGLETGVDCGGGACQACANGTACQVASDCQSQRCQSAVCVNAGCTDQIRNGKETDVDCGGGECAPCAPTLACADGADCASRICRDDACTAPSCSDATQNQGESDVDCGGPSCTACEIGKACFVAEDCDSALCQSGMCVPGEAGGHALGRSGWTLETSEDASLFPPEKALDGVEDSCWISQAPQASGMYVQLDLGEPRYFFQLLLRNTAQGHDQELPKEVDVYVSKDGTFGDAVLLAKPSYNWTWLSFSGAQVGRYLRVVITRTTPYPWTICEIEVFD